MRVKTDTRIAIQNILFLTDFSEPSERALPYALAIARNYGAAIHALHVMMPQPYPYTTPELMALGQEAQEEAAEAEMQKLNATLDGVAHDMAVVRGFDMWDSVKAAVENTTADLIVLGTHGRTGAGKLLLGSIAEDIFRRSEIPVLTVGPAAHNGVHGAANFHNILFATDFTPHSLAAAPYAISLAQENDARLTMLHIIGEAETRGGEAVERASIDRTLDKLAHLVPTDAQSWCKPEALLGFGKAAERILETAKDKHADLIVLGVRNAGNYPGAATHLGRAVAHKIVAHAACPVLTVRG